MTPELKAFLDAYLFVFVVLMVLQVIGVGTTLFMLVRVIELLEDNGDE